MTQGTSWQGDTVDYLSRESAEVGYATRIIHLLWNSMNQAWRRLLRTKIL